jgi:hypothetical protein
MSIYKYLQTVQASFNESRLLSSPSWFLGYLVLTGIPLLLALPGPSRIDEWLEPKTNFLGVFSVVAPLLLILYALNMGVAHAKSSPSVYALAGPVALLVLLSLPYWTIYQGLTVLAPERLLFALIYLLGQGLCWAYGGWLIALRWPSEIMQFNIKYALLALVLIATFFVLHPLNPFLMLSLWLSESPLHGQGGFLAVGYGGLLIILMILSFWISRVKTKEPR